MVEPGVGQNSAQICEQFFLKIRTLGNNLLQALYVLHQNGIVHGDIKPKNILVNPETVDIKFIDFGFSVAIDDKIPKEGFLRGTYILFPPQKLYNFADPKIQNIINSLCTFQDIQAYDLWAMGIILLALVNYVMVKQYKTQIQYNSMKHTRINNFIRTFWKQTTPDMLSLLEQIPTNSIFKKYFNKFHFTGLASNPDHRILRRRHTGKSRLIRTREDVQKLFDQEFSSPHT
jgi:serine/threonine protein kinase